MIVIVFTAIVYVVKLMRDQYESEIICCKSKKNREALYTFVGTGQNCNI